MSNNLESQYPVNRPQPRCTCGHSLTTTHYLNCPIAVAAITEAKR